MISESGASLERVEVSVARRVVVIHDDSMAYFLSRYDDETAPVVASQMTHFFAYVKQLDDWVGVGPKALLAKRLQANRQMGTTETSQRS